MLRVLKAVEQDEGGAEGKGGVGRAGLGVSLGTPSVAGTSQSVLNNGGGGGGWGTQRVCTTSGHRLRVAIRMESHQAEQSRHNNVRMCRQPQPFNPTLEV